MDTIVEQDYTNLKNAKDIFSKAILQRNKLENALSYAFKINALNITPDEWNEYIEVNKIHKLFKTRKYKISILKNEIKSLTKKNPYEIIKLYDQEHNLLNQRINNYFNKWQEESKK